MSARAIMVLGTASHVGKSLLAAALCRILSDDGYRVAPFKAQNMSLNSAATPDGREIGRAQAMQAEAARIAPTVEMNPLLLKPTSDMGSQIVLLGRVYGNQRAADYHRRRVQEFFPVVCDAYRTLAARHDVIVLEGAGSPAEINLKATDIVNMRMAEVSGAACLLVGDIDRGGVFAALLGTLALLEPHERARVRGFAINKFRGDAALLAPGVAEIERRIGVPSLGVVPWLRDVGLDEEDGVAYADAPRIANRAWSPATGTARPLRVAVVAFPYLANATDFAALGAEPSVDHAYAERPGDIAHADVVVLPGTKDTLGALRWLDGGFGAAIRAFATRGTVFGICGGYQALGEAVADPYGVEGGGSRPGLALLPVETVLAREKVTRAVRVRPRAGAFFGDHVVRLEGGGYEIHMGRTTLRNGARPFADLTSDGEATIDGAVSPDAAIAGTYVHGLFADDALRWAFVEAARERAGLAPAARLVAYGAEREARFDRLAAHVRGALDVRCLIDTPMPASRR
ncbi:MAG: cobyric acid synthase [Vulcanimicrobiaceae bacterium]